MCFFPNLPRFAAKCRILKNGVHLLAQDTYVNVHIGNKHTQFAIFCILPATNEKAMMLTASPLKLHYEYKICFSYGDSSN